MRRKWNVIIALFLIVLGGLTATINSWNAKYFGLQNATVAALVENKTFALVDQVIPGFNLVEGTETFRFGKYVYPMKQPGGTIIGALVYWPLYKLGFTFHNHFDYVSHAITFGTSSIMITLGSMLIFWVVLDITHKKYVSMVSALIFVFGTIIWPYSGVLHHDIYGVFWGLCALTSFYFGHKEDSVKKYLWAGFFATFALFFTMLPLTLPLVFWLITLLEKRKKYLLAMSLGMLIGFVPNMIFNYITFNNPLLPPNMAGKVSDTVPLLSLSNLVSKISFYLLDVRTSLFVFSPILIFGVIGIWYMYRNKIWLSKTLILVCLLELLHISSMETFGGYQYGPRYLLPIIGSLIIGAGYWLSINKAKVANLIYYTLAMYSFLVAIVGALQTVMYPIPGKFAPTTLAKQILIGQMPMFRMLPFGILLIMLGALIFCINKIQTSQRN